MLQRSSNRAFTLLELIVVIVILALLAALAIPTFSRVTKTSKLETAEVTASAVVRNAQALAALNQSGVFTEADVTTAASELGGGAAAGLSAAGTAGVRAVFSPWEFSGSSSVISAHLSPDAKTLGVAIWVPGAGCSMASSVTTFSGTESGHVFADDIDVTNCNGAAAGSVESDEALALLRSPRRPVIKLGAGSEGCPNAGERKVSWVEESEFPGPLDLFIGGVFVGTVNNGTCVPMPAGTTDSDVVGLPTTNQVGATSPAPRDGAAGSGSTPVAPLAPAAAGTTYQLTWTGGPGTIRFVPSTGTPTEVRTNATSGQYASAPSAGSFRVVLADGREVTPSLVRVSAPRAVPASGEGALALGQLDGTIIVNWGSVDGDPTAPLTGYRLYRGTGTTEAAARAEAAGRALTDTLQTPAKEAVKAVDGPLTATGWYCYALSAYGPAGDSGKSNVACAQLGNGVPNLSASPSDKAASASWSAVAGATEYRLSAFTPEGTLAATLTRPTGSTSATISGLTNGVTYTLVLTATTASSTTRPVSVKVTPGATAPPAGLLYDLSTTGGTWVNPVNSGEVIFSTSTTEARNPLTQAFDRNFNTWWNGTSSYVSLTMDVGAGRQLALTSLFASTGQGDGAVLRGSNDGATWKDVWVSQAGSLHGTYATSDSSPYRYFQWVRNPGSSSWAGLAELEFYGSVVKTAPTALTLSAPALGRSGVSLAGSAKDASTYSFYRSSSPSMSAATLVGTGASATDSGLTPGSTYYYQLSATSKGGTSSSSPLAVTPSGASSYGSMVLADDPYAYWRLDDTGTTALDSTKRATKNNGTYNAGVTRGAAPVLSSNEGTSGLFNNGMVLAPSLFNVGAGALTVEAWTCDVTAGTVIQSRDGSGTYGQWVMGFDGSKRPYFLGWNGNYETTTSPTPLTGGCHHIVAVRSGTSLTLYVDGKAAATGTLAQQLANFSVSIGGDRRDNNTYANGRIDEVAVYDKALTANQVLNHYVNR
jgi:prepilin-type N-terminal cleavage/methylation domain-containing protein